MKTQIFQILGSWLERKLPSVKNREFSLEKYFEKAPNKIIVLTGFRRTGKTFILYGYIQELLKIYSRKQIIYINFEDERIPIETDFLTQLLPAIKELFKTEPVFLFLDEIQVIPNWSKWLRRIHDTTEIKLVITGSNSKISVVEIPTELRGRFIEKHIRPLNFKEFLHFKNFKYDLETIQVTSSGKAELLSLLNEFIFTGSLPEIALSDESFKEEICQSYFKTVISRDIFEKFNIRNSEALKALIKLLLNSKIITLSKLSNTIKSLQIKVGKNTIAEYLSYIENAYFFKYLSCFSYKIKDEYQHPRKIYCVDNSFINYISTRYSGDPGWLFETTVAQELFRRNQNVYYWKSIQNGYEVDFVIKDELKIFQLIQVCYDISDPETLKREIRALLTASKELKCKDLLLINNL
ncbi:MAG: ATP-binding protein, partial [Bacteroidia bacterium]|nr:ATP-binding protein [Bacteroidia bacterium]